MFGHSVVRNSGVVAVAVIFTTAVAAVALHLVRRQDAKPKGEFVCLSTAHLDLGTGRPNEHVRGSFRLRSNAEVPISFSIARTCHCTSVASASGVLRPGSRLPISVSLRLPSSSNTTTSATLTISTDHAGSQPLVCTLSGSAEAPLEAVPSAVDFGTLTPRTSGGDSHTVHFRQGKNALPLVREDVCVSHDTEFFRVEAVPLDGRPLGGLRVSLASDLPYGHYLDRIHCRVDRLDWSFEIPVQVCIAGPLAAVPPSLVIRFDAESRSYRPAQVIVVGREPDVTIGPVDLAGQSPQGILRVDDAGSVGTRARRVKVRVDEGSLTALAQSLVCMRLRPRGSERECEVKVLIEARPQSGNP